MYVGRKIRLYPTEEQEILLWKHINYCRNIWNYLLTFQNKQYEENHKIVSFSVLSKEVTRLKHTDEYNYFNDVSCGSLQKVAKNLDSAYHNFFQGHTNLPKYKSKKKSPPTYPLPSQRLYIYKDGVKLPKFDNIIKIKSINNYKIGDKIYNPHISFIDKKWILSFSINYDNQVEKIHKDYKTNSMGIDLGIKEFAVICNDYDEIIFHNINKTKKVKRLENKAKNINRILSRKYRENYKKNHNYNKTKNIIKYENILRKTYRRLSNIRENYIHQVTNYIIKLRPKRIVIENLNITGMIKNRRLSKAILNQCFGMFIWQMKYKCNINDIELIQANRFFPSSKKCSRCGNIKPKLKLSERIYKCDKCGLIIDRDFNASINLMNYQE